MKRALSALALATALAALATPATAQIGWQVGGGITKPSTDGADNGFHGMLAGNLALTGAPLGLRADAMYHTFEGSSIIGLNGDLKFAFMPGPVSPYVLGGFSWGRFSVDGVDATNSETGYNLGGGITFGLSSLRAFAEIRHVKLGDGDAMYPITVGVHF